MVVNERPPQLAQYRQNFTDCHRFGIRDQIGLADRDWIIQREDNRGDEIVDCKQ